MIRQTAAHYLILAVCRGTTQTEAHVFHQAELSEIAAEDVEIEINRMVDAGLIRPTMMQDQNGRMIVGLIG